MTVGVKPSFRADIEGLRAVAVLLVMLFHAGLPVSGGYVGVDVFFVISGFLITGLLLREAEATGKISLLDFYARRARRLLPAASLVLIVSALAIWRLAPPIDRSLFAGDVIAAALYVVNWRFAERSVDYLAEDVGRSPVLHFWSLSVEEQYYLIWPLLIGGALLLARRLKFRLRPSVAAGLGLVLVPSLGWSIGFTETSQTEAFFVTSTRLWELAVGALLSLAAARVEALPRYLGPACAWLGCTLIAASALLFDQRTVWPSYSALAPTLGAALVIAGGTLTRDHALARWLGSRPMVWVGGLSYSLYLWHWPMLIVGQDWMDLELGLSEQAAAALLVGASFVPAWLSYRVIERPVRFARRLGRSPLGTLSLAGNLSLATVVAGLATMLTSQTQTIMRVSSTVELAVARDKVTALPAQLGAGALGEDPTRSPWALPRDHYETMTVLPEAATKDIPRAYREGCQVGFKGREPRWCEVGDPLGKRRGVVLGDSKILQYYEALDAAGKALGWRFVTATKSACSFSEAELERDGKRYTACTAFNRAVLEELEANPPDAVLTGQGSRTGVLPGAEGEPTESGMVRGLAAFWQRLQARGVKVVVVLDNAEPHSLAEKAVYACMLAHPKESKQCAFARKLADEENGFHAQVKAARMLPGIGVVDLRDYICPGQICPPVIGDVLIYRQGSHITNTYALTLAPLLTERLKDVLRPSR